MKNKNIYDVPFNQPTIVGKELYYITQVIQSGYVAGDGAFTKKKIMPY